MNKGPKATLSLHNQPMDCCFHPSEPCLAVGIIDGKLQMFGMEDEGTKLEQRYSVKAHSDSCRTITFMPDGRLLVTASADRSILALDAETGKAQARKKDAHACGVNRLLSVGGAVLASGDESGGVKFWDTRQAGCIATAQAHKEFVADMALHEGGQSLVTASGEGTLAVLDLRTHKLSSKTEEDADDELLSVVVLKNGAKLAAGAQSGVINLYSWGAMKDCSDRFPGHPESVDALVKFDEDTVLSGSSDGLIRVLSVLPNRMLGVVGEHGDDPVERLAITGDRRHLASAAHDDSVKVWDLGFLHEDGDDEEEEEEEEQAQEQEGERKEEDSDDSDGGGAQRGKKRQRGQHKIRPKRQAKTASFFADIM